MRRSSIRAFALVVVGVILATAATAFGGGSPNGSLDNQVAHLHSQVAQLRSEVAQLELFNKKCLQPVHLAETPQGWMAWDQNDMVLPTPHGAVLLGIPDTAVPALVCP